MGIEESVFFSIHAFLIGIAFIAIAGNHAYQISNCCDDDACKLRERKYFTFYTVCQIIGFFSICLILVYLLEDPANNANPAIELRYYDAILTAQLILLLGFYLVCMAGEIIMDIGVIVYEVASRSVDRIWNRR